MGYMLSIDQRITGTLVRLGKNKTNFNLLRTQLLTPAIHPL